MAQDPIDVYVQILLTEAGLGGLSADEQAGFVERLRAEVDRRIGLLAIQELDDAGVRDLENLMSREPAPDSLALQEFFNTRIPDFKTKLGAGLKDFAESFVAAGKQR